MFCKLFKLTGCDISATIKEMFTFGRAPLTVNICNKYEQEQFPNISIIQKSPSSEDELQKLFYGIYMNLTKVI